MTNKMNVAHDARKCCLFLDWLSMYGISRVDFAGTLPRGWMSLTKGGSMWFDQVIELRKLHRGIYVPFVVVCTKPKSPVMTPDTISMKFANNLLYRADAYSEIVDFLRIFEVQCTKITRVDIAYDFQRLSNNMSGSDLLYRLMNGQIIRKGSRKMAIHGKARYHIKPNGDIEDKKGGCESITFGTHASVCQWQLYNKSEELRQAQVKDYNPKQYIRDCWKNAGLDEGERDVWRIEVRLTSNARTLLNTTTGELIPMTLRSLSPENFELAVRSIFAKWSVLYYVPKDLSSFNHTDRLKRVAILDGAPEEVVSMPRADAEKQGLPHSSYIKGVMSTIQKFTECYRDILSDPTDAYILSDAKNAIESIYSTARERERRAQWKRVLQMEAEHVAMMLEFDPQLTPTECTYFSYLKAMRQVQYLEEHNRTYSTN